MQGYRGCVWTVSSQQFERAVRELRGNSLICMSRESYQYDKYLSISPKQYISNLMLKHNIPNLSHHSGEATKLGGTVSLLIQYSMLSKNGTQDEARAFLAFAGVRAVFEIHTLLRFIHLIDAKKAYVLLTELRKHKYKDSPSISVRLDAKIAELGNSSVQQMQREPYAVHASMQGSFSEVDVIPQKLITDFVLHAAQRSILQRTIREGILLRDAQGAEEQIHLGERRMTKAVQQLLCID